MRGRRRNCRYINEKKNVKFKKKKKKKNVSYLEEEEKNCC